MASRAHRERVCRQNRCLRFSFLWRSEKEEGNWGQKESWFTSESKTLMWWTAYQRPPLCRGGRKVLQESVRAQCESPTKIQQLNFLYQLSISVLACLRAGCSMCQHKPLPPSSGCQNLYTLRCLKTVTRLHFLAATDDSPAALGSYRACVFSYLTESWPCSQRNAWQTDEWEKDQEIARESWREKTDWMQEIGWRKYKRERIP